MLLSMAYKAQQDWSSVSVPTPQPPLYTFTQTSCSHSHLSSVPPAHSNFSEFSCTLFLCLDPLPSPQPAPRFFFCTLKTHIKHHFLFKAFSDPHICLSENVIRYLLSLFPNVTITALPGNDK